jgi:hypothetical protein
MIGNPDDPGIFCALGGFCGTAMLELHWEHETDRWALKPSRKDGWAISVTKNEDGFWAVWVGDRPLQGRYTSEQGAKLDAWEFAYSKRKALFDTVNIRLRM